MLKSVPLRHTSQSRCRMLVGGGGLLLDEDLLETRTPGCMREEGGSVSQNSEMQRALDSSGPRVFRPGSAT